MAQAAVAARSALPPGPSLPPWRQTLAWVRRPGPFLDDCARRFGSRFTLRFVGGRDYVIVSEAEDVRQVFAAPPDALLAGRANAGFEPFLGKGSLFVLDGEGHRRHRRLLAPAIQGDRMRVHGTTLRALVEAAVATWPQGRPFSLVDEMNAVTLQAILRAVFGVADDARAARLTKLVRRSIGRAPALLAFVPALRVDLGRASPWGRFLAAVRELDAVLLEEIGRARRAPEGRDDALGRVVAEMARTGQELSDGELRDELVTLLAAGHETTTAALAWAFLFVLGDREVAARATAEARAAQDAPAPYLEAVAQETLRLCPPIPIVPRWLQRDYQIGPSLLPAGTYVCPSPYLTQRDPRLYPEPLAFRPQRFLDAPRRAPHELLPFGGGTRTCIGMAFAAFEMEVVLRAVLARADLRLVGAVSLEARRRGIILAPASGPRVVLERRRP